LLRDSLEENAKAVMALFVTIVDDIIEDIIIEVPMNKIGLSILLGLYQTIIMDSNALLHNSS
jgi:hypothetical protein